MVTEEFPWFKTGAASIIAEKQRRAETEPLQSAVNGVSNFSAEATTPAGTVGVDEEHELGRYGQATTASSPREHQRAPTAPQQQWRLRDQLPCKQPAWKRQEQATAAVESRGRMLSEGEISNFRRPPLAIFLQGCWWDLVSDVL